MLSTFQSPLFRQYMVVIIVNLSMICAGMSLGWASPVLVKLRDKTAPALPEPITEEEGSWIVAIGFLVSIFTNFLATPLLDIVGRKYALIISCLPRLVAGFLYIFASNFWMILIGRAISGAADSMTMAATSVFASEVASKEIRGFLGTFLQMFCSLGILIMLSMGPFISYLSLNIVFTVSTATALIPIFFLPDSPYFLYSKGCTDESMKVLIFYRGSSQAAKEELKEYASSGNVSKVNKREIFKDRTFLKAFGIVIVIGLGTNLIGFNAVSFYLQTILESTQTSIRDEMASVIIGCIQLSAAIIAAIILDKFGRKPILGSTLGIMAVGMFGMGTFFYIRDNSDSGNIAGAMNFVPLISLIFVTFGFSAGPGTVFWLLITELFEGPARAIGISCFSVLSNLTVFLTTRFLPSFTTQFGPAAVYWFFGSMCILFNLFIIFVVPETKGKSFREIQLSLGAKQRVDIDKSTII